MRPCPVEGVQQAGTDAPPTMACMRNVAVRLPTLPPPAASQGNGRRPPTGQGYASTHPVL